MPQKCFHLISKTAVGMPLSPYYRRKGTEKHPLDTQSWVLHRTGFLLLQLSPFKKSFCLTTGEGDAFLRDKEKKVRPFSMFDSVDQSAGLGTLRKNQSSEDLLREAQVCVEHKLLRSSKLCQVFLHGLRLLHSFTKSAIRKLFEKLSLKKLLLGRKISHTFWFMT